MNIKIVREQSADTGTPGILIVPSIDWRCHTLELPWRNNEKGVSCIMADTYRCTVGSSPSLHRTVLRLEDRYGRTDCLIHNGNWAGDSAKGLFAQVHGCTLVGTGYAEVERPDGAPQFGIINSVKTLETFLAAIGPGPHAITYSWDDGCAPADLSNHLA